MEGNGHQELGPVCAAPVGSDAALSLPERKTNARRGGSWEGEGHSSRARREAGVALAGRSAAPLGLAGSPPPRTQLQLPRKLAGFKNLTWNVFIPLLPVSQALKPLDLPPGAQCTHCPPHTGSPCLLAAPTLSPRRTLGPGLLFFRKDVRNLARGPGSPSALPLPTPSSHHICWSVGPPAGSAWAPEPPGPNAQQSGPSPRLCLNLRLGHGRRPAPQPLRPTYSPSCTIPTQPACSRLSVQSSWDLSGVR